MCGIRLKQLILTDVQVFLLGVWSDQLLICSGLTIAFDDPIIMSATSCMDSIKVIKKMQDEALLIGGKYYAFRGNNFI